MSLRLIAVGFDAHEPDAPAEFWAGMLNRRLVGEATGALLPGDDTQVGLRFVEAAAEDSSRPNRVHLHLTSGDIAGQEHTIEKALELGGRLVRRYPDEGHVVMADPGGNEFCVIEPGNDFLAGCGLLGEITCEGTPAVGRFWSDALGWPLVWDKGQQTAVQSPLGGTKLSWDVHPGPHPYGNRRQSLHLAASDPEVDVARLVALGATELGKWNDRVVLADPDGYEFLVGWG